MRFVALTALAAAVLLPVVPARAQEPLFHGVLAVKPAPGAVDKGGRGSLRVRNWELCLISDSNGIAPDREPVIVALGESERLVIPVGQLRPSRSGKKFTYRNPGAERGVRFLQLRQMKSDRFCAAPARYRVRVTLAGIDLSRLLIEYPVCVSMAVIIDDDDGFTGIELDRPGGFDRPKIRVLGACQAEAWPWT